jgi:hypothetical protein
LDAGKNRLSPNHSGENDILSYGHYNKNRRIRSASSISRWSNASEIMYEHYFLQLEEEARSNLVVSYTPLVWFSVEKVHPIGEVTL